MQSQAPQPVSPEAAQAIAAGMPPCPNCNGRNVRPSLVAGIRDTVAGMFRYSPFRCRVCQHRLYKRLSPTGLGGNPAPDSNR